MSNFIALIRFSLRNTILKYKSMVNAYPHIALKYRDPCHNQRNKKRAISPLQCRYSVFGRGTLYLANLLDMALIVLNIITLCCSTVVCTVHPTTLHCRLQRIRPPRGGGVSGPAGAVASSSSIQCCKKKLIQCSRFCMNLTMATQHGLSTCNFSAK